MSFRPNNYESITHAAPGNLGSEGRQSLDSNLLVFAGGGGLIMAPSQCSSALPPTNRHMSNHVVVYFFDGSRGSVNSRGVATITRSPSATTATILVFMCSGTGLGLRMDMKNFTTPSRPEATLGLC